MRSASTLVVFDKVAKLTGRGNAMEKDRLCSTSSPVIWDSPEYECSRLRFRLEVVYNLCA